MYIVIHTSLQLIETCIDLVRVEELSELERQVDRIMEKILNKKQSIEVTKSKIRFRNSEFKKSEHKS